VPAKGKGAADFNHVSAVHCANRGKSVDFAAFYAARWTCAGTSNSQFVTFGKGFPQLIV
jgi:replication-associated recombination protein RarA